MDRIRLLLETSFIDPSQSKHVLRQLRKGCDGINLVLVARVTSRGRLDVGASRHATSLTPRQTEVLREMAMGRGMREIGQRLGISPKTAETHRQNLMQRLGIWHLPGLVRYALRAGILPLTWLTKGS